MNLLAFDWRQGLLLLAAAAAIYLLLTLLRLARLRRRRAEAEAAAERAAIDDAVWPARWNEPAPTPAPAPADEEPPPDFGEQLAGSRLELEVRQLREEVGILRREIGELKAARRVSPQYADAMALARRGFDAQGIADECGIAVAEAELVLALSRDGVQFDDEGDDGGQARSTAGSAGQ